MLAMMPGPEQVRSSSLRSTLSPDQILCVRSQEAKLNPHKTTPPEELDFLEPADRFLVECLKMYRVKPRVKSMVYREHFLDVIGDLEEEAQKIYDAAQDLLNAPHFSELLKVSRLTGSFQSNLRANVSTTCSSFFFSATS